MIGDFRKDIDSLDDELIIILNKRMEIVKELMRLKKEEGVPIENKEREEEVISRLVKKNLIPEKMIREIYGVIFKYGKTSSF